MGWAAFAALVAVVALEPIPYSREAPTVPLSSAGWPKQDLVKRRSGGARVPYLSGLVAQGRKGNRNTNMCCFLSLRGGASSELEEPGATQDYAGNGTARMRGRESEKLAAMAGDVCVLLRQAEGGNATAMFVVGCCFQEGVGGCALEDKAAFRCFLAAGQKGHLDAIYNVACCYALGMGVLPDQVKASLWFAQGARKGDVECQYILGVRTQEGNGVVQDEEEATEYLITAAQQGHVGAQYNVGVRYLTGVGMSVRSPGLSKWDGLLEGSKLLGHSPALQISHPGEWAPVGWNSTAGQGGARGVGERRPDIAAEWFKKAAAQGHERALFNLACMYEKGEGIPQSDDECIVLLREAALKNYSRAQYKLALKLYEQWAALREQVSEEGMPRNGRTGRSGEVESMAVRTAEVIGGTQGMESSAGNQSRGVIRVTAHNASQGNESINGEMDHRTSSQEPCLADVKKLAGVVQPTTNFSLSCTIEAAALTWLQRAAKHGHAKALYSLGLRYQDGRGGLQRNLDMAVRCFRKAARRGVVKAEERAEECETNLKWERDPEGMKREERRLGKEALQRSLQAHRSRDIKNRLIFPGAKDQTRARQIFSEAIKQAADSKERLKSIKSFIKKLQPKMEKKDLKEEAPDVGYQESDDAFILRGIDSDASDYTGSSSNDSSEMVRVKHVGLQEALKVEADDPLEARIRKSILKSMAKVDPARLKKQKDTELKRQKKIQEKHRRIAVELNPQLKPEFSADSEVLNEESGGKKRCAVGASSINANDDEASVSGKGSRTIQSCSVEEQTVPDSRDVAASKAQDARNSMLDSSDSGATRRAAEESNDFQERGAGVHVGKQSNDLVNAIEDFGSGLGATDMDAME